MHTCHFPVFSQEYQSGFHLDPGVHLYQKQVHADAVYLGFAFLFLWFPMGHTAARDTTARVEKHNFFKLKLTILEGFLP